MTCERIESKLVAFLSGELDSSQANGIRAHVEQCPACAAELESIGQAAAALRGLGVRAMPGPAVSRVRQELAKHRKPTRKPLLLGLRSWALAGTPLVVAALLVGLMLFRQQPLTAAQIMARTKTAVTRLTSWHFRYKYKQTEGNRVAKPIKYADEWYKAPDKRRYQEESSGTRSEPSWVKLVRGDEELLYDPERKIANFRALTTKDQQDEARYYERRSFQPPYAASRYHIRKARIVGTERILGRLCDVITGDISARFRLRVAVDRETGIPLRTTVSQERVEYTTEMVAFEPNKEIADDVFQVKLPSDVAIIRGPVYSAYDVPNVDLSRLKDPAETENQIRLTLGNDPPGSALKVVYKPTYIPAGYTLHGVYLGRRCVTDRDFISRRLDADYVNPKSGGTLLLTQSVQTLFDGGDAINICGFNGRISSFTSPYPYSILTWIKDDTHFTLIGSDVGRSELLKVAESMRPLRSLVPGLGTGQTWRITAQVLDKPSAEMVAFTPDVVQRRFRILGVFGATVAKIDRDHIAITARAKDPDLITRSVLMPGYVSFVPVPNGSAAGRMPVGAKALITQDNVQFRDRRGPREGKPIFLDLRLRYPFYDARLGKHEGPHAHDILAIVIDDQQFVVTVTKGALVAGTRIGPLAPDVAAILETTPLPARLRVISKKRI